MVRRVLTVGTAVLMCLVVGRVASAQTVEEIVDKNIQAKGGLTKIQSVQTVRQTGRVTLQGTEAQLTILAKRPNLMRQEMAIQGQTVVMAYDGVTPWVINPLLGSTSPIVMTGPMAEQTREQSAFDGSPLIDYKEKGAKVELVGGAEALGTTKVFHLKLTSKSGQIQHIYIDTTTFLDAKLTSEVGMLEQELLDYRDVEGIKVPFHIRIKQNGVVQSEIKMDKVVFNVKVDDAVFKIPK